MNLSRAAKKFRQAEDPQESKRRAAKQKAAQPAKAPEAVKVPEPAIAPEPEKELEPAPTPEAEVSQPAPPTEAAAPEDAKKKRPRFVFVRQKTEAQDQSKLPPLPQPSKNVFAKLMSKNLALPPKEEPTKAVRG